MSNVFTALAMSQPLNQTGDQTTFAYSNFLLAPALPLAPIRDSFCVYIDPNPVETITGDGHNYFRSSNPSPLNSSIGRASCRESVCRSVYISGDALSIKKKTTTYSII